MGESAPVIVHLTIRNHAQQRKDARDGRIKNTARRANGMTRKLKYAATERVIIGLSLWTGMIRVISGRTKHDKIHNRRNHRHWDCVTCGGAAVAKDGRYERYVEGDGLNVDKKSG